MISTFGYWADEMQNPIVSKAEEIHEDYTQLFILKYRSVLKEKTFSKVLRSTKEISEASMAIREIIHEIDTGPERDNFRINECESFHLIHGPKPVLHVLENNLNKHDEYEQINHNVKDYVEIYKRKHETFGKRSAIAYNFMPGSRLRKWDFVKEQKYSLQKNLHDFEDNFQIIFATGT